VLYLTSCLQSFINTVQRVNVQYNGEHSAFVLTCELGQTDQVFIAFHKVYTQIIEEESKRHSSIHDSDDDDDSDTQSDASGSTAWGGLRDVILPLSSNEVLY